MGKLTDDAREAAFELDNRIDNAEIRAPATVHDTWFLFGDDGLDPEMWGEMSDDEICEAVLKEAKENAGVRIWGGKDALLKTLKELRADAHSSDLDT